MTSSTSSSTRERRGAVAAALLLALTGGAAGCAHRPPAAPPGELGLEAGERLRVAVLPVENLSGGVAPLREVRAAVEAALGSRVELVSVEELDPFLERHRIRYTGGVDAETARAAREELHAHAVLVTTLDVYRASPPAIAVSMRLVSTRDEPVILWMDAATRAGDESPGLLRLGVVESVPPLQQEVVARLAGSLARYAEGRGGATPRCGGAWYAPKVRYRSSILDARQQRTLAILPFLNQTQRRGAGDAVSLEFVRHLVATGRFRVLEPGVVREYLLRARIMIPGGASLETTRLMLGAMSVDLVLSGAVIDFDDSPGPQGATIRFNATLLDGASGQVLWHSSSYNRGDDGVFAFGLGRVRTSEELSCRMVNDVVHGLLTPGSTPGAPRPEDVDRAVEADWWRARTRAREREGGAER
jgi:TolB-like protein